MVACHCLTDPLSKAAMKVPIGSLGENAMCVTASVLKSLTIESDTLRGLAHAFS